MHFLADPTAAEHWTREGAARLVLDLDDAFALGRRMIGERCGLAPGPPTAATRD